MSTDNKIRERFSDTERKRREHAARILKPKSSEITSNEEFICTPQFKNPLPSVPSGPFFRTVELPHSSADFAVYTVSSLEKQYIWQPHHGADVGLHLDLVDQDAVLCTTQKSGPVVDAKFLTEKRANVSNLGRIPFLKRPIYSTNDLFDNVNKFKGSEELEKGFKDTKMRSIGDKLNPFESNFISMTFDTVDQKTSSLVPTKRSTSGTPTMEWSIPVLPESDDLWGQNLSLVIFTDDALDSLSPDDGGASKRRKVCRSIATNIRPVEVKDEKLADGLMVRALSLTAPEQKETEEDDALNTDSVEYDWIGDFRMDIKSKKLDDHFEFSIDEKNGACTYCPLRSRIDLRRLKASLAEPHRVSVRHRDPLESEIADSEMLLSELM
mmetsp:Transcript_12571/g.18990  ORF Transcript_12571/g.18990 Transcript_12571/m.18990 type:complete len:382 (-) Transcript_12571:101-1246(-)